MANVPHTNRKPRAVASWLNSNKSDWPTLNVIDRWCTQSPSEFLPLLSKGSLSHEYYRELEDIPFVVSGLENLEMMF